MLINGAVQTTLRDNRREARGDQAAPQHDGDQGECDDQRDLEAGPQDRGPNNPRDAHARASRRRRPRGSVTRTTVTAKAASLKSGGSKERLRTVRADGPQTEAYSDGRKQPATFNRQPAVQVDWGLDTLLVAVAEFTKCVEASTLGMRTKPCTFPEEGLTRKLGHRTEGPSARWIDLGRIDRYQLSEQQSPGDGLVSTILIWLVADSVQR